MVMITAADIVEMVSLLKKWPLVRLEKSEGETRTSMADETMNKFVPMNPGGYGEPIQYFSL